MFYIQQDEKIVLFDEDKGKLEQTLEFMPQYKDLEILETTENETIVDFELLTLDEAEEQDKVKERERIQALTCTKRNFALMLQQYGVTYSQLKELISTNEQAQLEWELCERLERSNPLLDTMAAQLNITPDILDKMFQYANGEIDALE